MRTEAELREFLAFLEEGDSTGRSHDAELVNRTARDIARWCLGESRTTGTEKLIADCRRIRATYEPRLRKLDRRIGFFTKADYYLGAVAFALLLWAVIKAIFWE